MNGAAMSTLRYAWRNLWRNGKRTAITISAVTLNAAILIISYALMDGLVDHTVSNATNMVVGEAQVHAPGYLSDRSIYKYLSNPDEVMKIARDNHIGAAPRIYGYGLVSHGVKSAGALFWGVDPSLERKTFDLADHLMEGNFLGDRPDRGMVLGKKLARSLQASVGSEIVVVVQAADGSLGNELYRVTGILKSVGESVDRSAAIICESDFRELFAMPQGVHEVALNSHGSIPLEELTSIIGTAAGGDEVKTWRDLMGPLSDIVNLFDASMMIFGLIFFLAAGLGVMNTMLMATYERIHEFGVLKALGASPWRIVRDVLSEAVLLSFIATAVGMVLGIAGSYYFVKIGLDTRLFAGETSIAGVAFDPIWRADINLKVVLLPIVSMWVISAVASLYPAALAARLDPVRAINRV
jgi:ABC-type lipoprotein release transport system permease subunit